MPDSFKRRVAIGVAWMTAARAAVRGLGLVSTLVLARLLTPADFGLVAMATVVAAGLELLTLFGFDAALVQRREISRNHYDSAWTLNVLLGVGLAIALIAIAVPVANFYRDPRLVTVMYVISAKYAIESASNTGVVDFRRNINFRPDFAMQVGPKLFGIVVTIPLAFWLRDYRALLAGMLVSSGITFVASYVMHPHRPRWCLSEARVLYRFSRWLLLNNFIGFLRYRSVDLIIGRALGAAPLGTFSIASEISNLPSTEMVAPINRVLTPTYVQLADDLPRLRDAFGATLGLIALVVLPASVGLAAVADPLVHVMLGEKWLGAIPIMSLLALAGAGNVLQTNTGSLHNALGQPRKIAVTGAIQVAVLLPMLLFATSAFGLIGAAWAFLAHTIAIGLPTTYWIVCRTTPVRVEDLIRACWRPVVSCIVMYVAVRTFIAMSEPRSDLLHSLWVLFAACGLGMIVYSITICLLWLATGRPKGAESEVIEKIKPIVRWLARTNPGV